MRDVTGELDKELAPAADWPPTFHAAFLPMQKL
jgi:hypothetical protein